MEDRSKKKKKDEQGRGMEEDQEQDRPGVGDWQGRDEKRDTTTGEQT